jgi:hypothetical protein
MTVEERVMEWFRKNKAIDICDNCLLKVLRLGPSVQQVRNITASFGAVSELFKRAYGKCSDCGEMRECVTRLK